MYTHIYIIYIYIYIIYTSHQLTLLTSQRLTKAWGQESTKVMGRWVIWVVTGILRIKDITDWPSDILVLVLRRQSHCVTDCCDPATTGWWHFCKRLVQFSRIIQENCCDFRIRHDSWPIDCELGQGCSYCSVGAARGRSVKLKWDCSCKWCWNSHFGPCFWILSLLQSHLIHRSVNRWCLKPILLLFKWCSTK